MSWINLSAIWKIVVFGMLAGAGLPAIFALGLVALSRPGGTRTATARTATARAGGTGPASADDALIGGSLAGIVIAVICFMIVLAAIGWGIYEIYQLGHPATTSHK